MRVAPPLYSLAPRPEVRDPTPYPPLASKPDPSELLAPLPRVTPLPEAPVIILAPSAPVPLTEPVPPPVQAKIPEATIPPADPPRPPALPERTKLVLAPSLPPPPMPPPPPKSSSAAVESFLQCVCKCTSKHASPSRARRLIAALSEQLDLFEAALSDAALLQHLAGLLAESEQHYEVLAPATQLGQLVGDLEPEFAPLDLPSANAEACWALAATQRRLSPANAVLFDALAALLKERQSCRENRDGPRRQSSTQNARRSTRLLACTCELSSRAPRRRCRPFSRVTSLWRRQRGEVRDTFETNVGVRGGFETPRTP